MVKKNFLETGILRQIEFDIPVWLAWYNIFLYHVSCALSGFWEFCTIWKFIHHQMIGLGIIMWGCRLYLELIGIGPLVFWGARPQAQPAMITATKAFHNSTKIVRSFFLTGGKLLSLGSFYSNKLFQWDVIRSKLVHLFVQKSFILLSTPNLKV